MVNARFLITFVLNWSFFNFLAFKESQAKIDEDSKFLEGYLLAQKDFLNRHPVQWVQKFCDLLCNLADIPFYNLFPRINAMFITWQLTNTLSA